MKHFFLKLLPLLIFNLLFVDSALGQTYGLSEYVDHYSSIVPTTPNSTPFTTYGNTSVDYSTGTPNINIPLYTISLDGITLPISISYDASGIKVDELAGIVGLKWRLNAGGGIFRVINNKPDEIGWTTQSWTSRDAQWYMNNPIGSGTTQTLLMNQPYDHSPDNFSYNFGNYFGSFIFKRKDINTILKNSNSNISIQRSNSFGQLLESFTAKDVYGNVYDFGTSIDSKEINSNTTIDASGNTINNPLIENYISSWLVKTITTKNNRTINFEYIDYDMEYTIYHRSQSIKKQKAHSGMPNDPVYCDEAIDGDLYDGTHYYTKSTVSTINRPKNKLVSKIYTDKEEVNFIYENYIPVVMPQGNNIWGKKLVRIEIKNKIDNVIVKIINFEYEVYSGDPRLKLKRLKEQNPQNSNEIPPYVFNYNQTYSLPNKQSYARDYFGYFNGANNTSLLVPFSEVAYANLPLSYKKNLADRRPSLMHAQSGNLIEVQYPTGGSTKFTYELNTEDNGFGEYKYVKDNVYISAQDPNYTISNGKRIFKKQFVIPAGTIMASQNSNVLVESNSNVSGCDINYPAIDCASYSIHQKNVNGTVGPIIGNPRMVGYTGPTFIPAGNYFLVLSVDQDDYLSNPNLQIQVDFKWLYRLEDPLNPNSYIKEPQYAGGLRIKKIVDVDSDNSEYNKTMFEYSGLRCVGWKEDYVNESNDFFGTYSSEPIIHKQLNKQGHFYENVTLLKFNGMESFKTKFIFEDNYSNFSYSSKKSKTFTYDAEDNLLNKHFYVYDAINTPHNYNILGKLNYCYSHSSADNRLGYNEPQNVAYYEYENRLIKEVSTEYFYEQSNNNLTGAISHQQEYTYNSDELISQKISDYQIIENQNLEYYDINNYSINPKEKRIITDYTFPKDHLNEVTFQNLVNVKNLIALPVSAVNFQDNTELSGNYLEYDQNGNAKGYYSFNKNLSGNNSNPNYIPSYYNLNFTYKHDLYGNPLEVSKTDGTSISYIWGYEQSQPIAKIENASYAQVQGYVSNLQTLSNADNDRTLGYNGNEGALREALDALRTSFPNAMISTYTYDPLVGITSMTDARGYTMFYEYDESNRLKQVKDAQGNILSENDYNYANQN